MPQDKRAGESMMCRRCRRIGYGGFSPVGAEAWECTNDRACNKRRRARGMDGGSVVIHRAAPGPLGMARWFVDPTGERYWLMYTGPGWGWELYDDSGNRPRGGDGLMTLEDVRRWAASWNGLHPAADTLAH